MVEKQLVVEEADHLENLGDLDTQPYLEKKLIEEELDKELNKEEVDKEFDYLENLEELELEALCGGGTSHRVPGQCWGDRGYAWRGHQQGRN